MSLWITLDSFFFKVLYRYKSRFWNEVCLYYLTVFIPAS